MAGTVFVVDDDSGIRTVLEHLFQSVGYCTQLYASGPEFLEKYPAGTRGCIVLDVRMPAMSGLELQSELQARGIDLPVILITGFADVAVVIRAFKAGAFDFIEKPFSDQHLLDVVARAIALDQEQQSLQTACAEVESRLARLSNREREILSLVMAGKTSKEIAVELQISARTVEAHRDRIMAAMGVTRVADLVRKLTTIHIARAEADARKGGFTAYAAALRAELREHLSNESDTGAVPPNRTRDGTDQITSR